MAGFFVDDSTLDLMVSELGLAGPEAIFAARKVLTQSATRIKADARTRAAGIGAAVRGYAPSISYEFNNPLEVEVGPVLGGQGSLGGILEFGSPTSGPHPHLHPAFDAELPKLDDAIGDAAINLLRSI